MAHQLLTPLEENLGVLKQRAGEGLLSKGEAVEMGILTAAIHEISLFLDYMDLFSDQITRRILQGKEIPSDENVFSMFKPFTRWVVKGKVGILCELGVPVAFLEDEHPVILGYGIPRSTSLARPSPCGSNGYKARGENTSSPHSESPLSRSNATERVREASGPVRRSLQAAAPISSLETAPVRSAPVADTC